MHKHNGMNLDGLLMIDYLFHGSMVVAGVFLASIQMRALGTAPATEQAPDRRVAHAATGD